MGEDQHVVEALASHRLHPALGVGVRTRRPHWRAEGLDPFGPEDLVEGSGEFGVAISDQETGSATGSFGYGPIGLTAVFASFKWDSFHEQFIRRYGRGVIPAEERGFVRWWFGMYPDMPPRLVNECIWLGTEQKVV